MDAIEVAPLIRPHDLPPSYVKEWSDLAGHRPHVCVKCSKGLFGGRFFSLATGEQEVIGSDQNPQVTLSIDAPPENIAPRHCRLTAGRGTSACQLQDISSPEHGVFVATRHIHKKRIGPGNSLLFEMLTPQDLGVPITFNHTQDQATKAANVAYSPHTQYSPEGPVLLIERGPPSPTDLHAFNNFLAVYELDRNVQQWILTHCTNLKNQGSCSDLFEAFKSFKMTQAFTQALQNLPLEDQILLSLAAAEIELFMPWETKSESLRIKAKSTGEVLGEIDWTGAYIVPFNHTYSTGEHIPSTTDPSNVPKLTSVAPAASPPLPSPSPAVASAAASATVSPTTASPETVWLHSLQASEPSAHHVSYSRPATARASLFTRSHVSASFPWKRRPESSRLSLLPSLPRGAETSAAWAFYKSNSANAASPTVVGGAPVPPVNPSLSSSSSGRVLTSATTSSSQPSLLTPASGADLLRQPYGSVCPRSQEPVGPITTLPPGSFRLTHDFYAATLPTPETDRQIHPSPIPPSQEVLRQWCALEQHQRGVKWLPIAHHHMPFAGPVSPTRSSVASPVRAARAAPGRATLTSPSRTTLSSTTCHPSSHPTRITPLSPPRASLPILDVQLPPVPQAKFTTIVDHEASPPPKAEHAADAIYLPHVDPAAAAAAAAAPDLLSPSELLRSDSHSAVSSDQETEPSSTGPSIKQCISWENSLVAVNGLTSHPSSVSVPASTKMFSPLKLLSTFFSPSPKSNREGLDLQQMKLPASCPVTLSSSPSTLNGSVPRSNIDMESFSKLPGIQLAENAIIGDAQLEPIVHDTAGIIWPELAENETQSPEKMADTTDIKAAPEANLSQGILSAMGNISFWVNVFLDSSELRILAQEHPSVSLPHPIPDLLQPNIYNSSSLFRNRGLGLPLQLTMLPRKLSFHIDKYIDTLFANVGGDASVTSEPLVVRFRRAKSWLLRTPHQVLLSTGNPRHRPVIKLSPSFGTGYHLSVKYINGEYCIFDTFPAESADFSFAPPPVRSVSSCNPPMNETNPFAHVQQDYDSTGGDSRSRKKQPQLDVVDAVWIKLVPNEEVSTLRFGDVFRLGDMEFQCLRFNTGFGGLQGYRPSMEDEEVAFQDLGISEEVPVSFYAVYDGHGGRDCAAFLHEELHLSFVHQLGVLTGHLDVAKEAARTIFEALYRAFVISDRAFLKLQLQRVRSSGTRNGPGGTAVVVVVAGDRLFCANCGDARAVLSRKGVAVQLSVDHKPDRVDETRRIQKAKGHVKNRRVLGRLAVSRAFGDIEYKCVAGAASALVIVDPEIRMIDLRPEDEFVILACDGLFDVYSSQEIVTIIRGQLIAHHGDAQKVVEIIVQDAIVAKQSRDNVSAILILLKQDLAPLDETRTPSR